MQFRSITLMVIALSVSASALEAQTCYGTPGRTGVAADYGKISFGTAIGATGTLVGGHAALALGFHSVNLGTNKSGYEGNTRFAVVIGGGKVSVCPAIGVAFGQTKWNPTVGELKSTYLIGTAGVGIGYEQLFAEKIGVIPFASIRFAYRAVKYDFTATNTDTRTTADTLSGAQMQYGLLVRYNILYIGFIADRPLNANPFSARGALGVTLPMRRETRK